MLQLFSIRVNRMIKINSNIKKNKAGRDSLKYKKLEWNLKWKKMKWNKAKTKK